MGFTVVAGLGPRVGTSYVMLTAKKAGLPVIGDKFPEGWCIPKHNPDGYWEFPPETLNNIEDTSEWEGKIIKLWYPTLLKLGMKNVDKVLILRRRELSNQVKSIDKVLKDEVNLPNVINHNLGHLTAKDILHLHYDGIERWFMSVEDYPEILDVYTEDINEHLDKILKFLRG